MVYYFEFLLFWDLEFDLPEFLDFPDLWLDALETLLDLFPLCDLSVCGVSDVLWDDFLDL